MDIRTVRAVNSRGDVAYNVMPTGSQWYDVYRNSENVSEWLGPGHTAYYFGINEAAQVAYGGYAGGWRNFEVFVDRTDWSSAVLNPEITYELSGGALAENGMPIWTSLVKGTRVRDLWFGHRRLTEGVSGEYYATFQAVNRRNDVLWLLNGDVTGWQRQIFLNERNISVPVVGHGAAVGLNAYLNDRGDVAWQAQMWDPQAGMISHVYVNDRNVSREVFGDAAWTVAGPRAINNRGDVAWGAKDVRLGPDYGSQDVFLNTENISYPILGDTYHEAGPIALNERGDLLWGAGYQLFVNSREVTDVPGRRGLIVDYAGIDEHGRVLWGDGGGWELERVWVDDVCLTIDVYGDEWAKYGSSGIQIGPNGHVLWASWRLDEPGSVTVWRSTPIPEPGSLPLLLPALLLLNRRRRRRAA